MEALHAATASRFRCWRSACPTISSTMAIPAKLLALNGLDAAGIERSIVERFGAARPVLRAAANL